MEDVTRLKELGHLRQKVVGLALVYLSALSAPVLLVSAIHAYQNGVNWYFIVQSCCYSGLLAGLLAKDKVCSFRLSLYVVGILALVGLAGILAWGPAPSRLIIVCFACLFAAIFTGTRAALITVGVSTVLMAASAWLHPYVGEVPGGDSISDHTPLQWLITLLCFALYTAAGALLVSWVMKSLQRTIVALKHNESGLRDANERLQEQADSLIEQRNLAQTSARAKERFLTIVSHELKTPLNPIVGFLRLMEDDASINEEARSQVSLMKRSAEHLDRLVSRVVNYSAIDRKDISTNPKRVSLGDLAREIAFRQGQSAIDASLEFSSDAGDFGCVAVKVDKRLLLDAVEELVANAVKFTSKGSVRVSFALESGQSYSSGELLVVEVADTGCGMREEERERLFEGFVQSDDSKTRQFEGVGLGLAVCDSLVQFLGGEIAVRSEKGVGSTFIVKVPCVRAGVEAADRPLSKTSVRARLELPVEVLVVEDDYVNQRVVRSLLKKMGATSRCVGNGEEALAELSNRRYDLILMDLSMPVMDGVTATLEIRARGLADETPIVALTAHSYAKVEEECDKAGMAAFLNKPVKYSELFETISDLTNSPDNRFSDAV